MNKDLIGSLMWGGGIVVLALIASWARSQGLIDQDTTTRIVLVPTGLMIAWFGNRAPKTFVPSARARAAKRVTGWSLAISGLIYAGAFAVAPLDTAVMVGCGAMVLGIALSFGYCLSLRHGARTA
ncbi:MAG: ammonium transporter [Alphaproteobacteria bacterium]|nr:ammonium transporter [Alphaproteobacteria bacterium]MBU1525250.1 ammonium transporter [Alphaproteobacteria bacterium]MBU2116498.1 ammonium transporter [Alphaproteobacteria bacterium]MBU2351196.1 ammonium transporter [Alphaproteobacteria bacterium]MBU2382656.1 ammonium transporter [Alphaproteobacteria bacterium]